MSEFVQRQLDEAKRIVLAGLNGHPARVYLYGSRARGDAWRWSDIDIAIEPLAPLPVALLGTIQEALEESCVVYNVDLVDLTTVHTEMRSEIEKEGLRWTA